ncbi:MAG: hypothetical protein SOZ51_03235 [Eubacteriales bacterium]|nr:hypothetical protein [Eubacteriales bacterium]
MKQYQVPMLCITLLNAEDILTASGLQNSLTGYGDEVGFEQFR